MVMVVGFPETCVLCEILIRSPGGVRGKFAVVVSIGSVSFVLCDTTALEDGVDNDDGAGGSDNENGRLIGLGFRSSSSSDGNSRKSYSFKCSSEPCVNECEECISLVVCFVLVINEPGVNVVFTKPVSGVRRKSNDKRKREATAEIMMKRP